MLENQFHWPLLSDYRQLPIDLHTDSLPTAIEEPSLFLWNKKLANTLNLEALNDQAEEITNVLSGNQIPEHLNPISQAYAGHQFGQFVVLGDGRAILLGELEANNQLYDIQLKGAGPTVYSRRGDGRATLYSMLREYLISEALHSLNIPCSRSLAIISSPSPVIRQQIGKTGVLTRVSSSHIRVGTFELAARLEDRSNLNELFQYTAKRHYPEVLSAEISALELFKEVMSKQINLVTQWMSVGFIHGVMNTDNTSICGESFDFGPCAFMNSYHPMTTFSSIDQQGRYSYGNQRPIIKWNLMRFAETLLPLIHDNIEVAIELCQTELDQFDSVFEERYTKHFLSKLGITEEKEGDKELLNELLKWMQDHLADFTNTFRGLTDEHLHKEDYYQKAPFINWKAKWESRTNSIADRNSIMNTVNPSIIPRNHLVEEALIKASENEDLSLFNEFLDELSTPFESSKQERLQTPPLSDEGYQTFCGT